MLTGSAPNVIVIAYALVTPTDIKIITKNRYEAPKNKIQEQMERTWNQVLGLERTSIKDSFFTIGGDSIKAIRLIGLLNAQLNTNFKIKDLYAHQSIEELAELVEQSRKGYTGIELNQVEQEITALKHRIMAKAVEMLNGE